MTEEKNTENTRAMLETLCYIEEEIEGARNRGLLNPKNYTKNIIKSLQKLKRISLKALKKERIYRL